MFSAALLAAVAEIVLGYRLQEADLTERMRGVPGVDAQRKAFPTTPARAHAV